MIDKAITDYIASLEPRTVMLGLSEPVVDSLHTVAVIYQGRSWCPLTVCYPTALRYAGDDWVQDMLYDKLSPSDSVRVFAWAESDR